MNNSLVKQTQKPKFSVVLQTNAMKNLINNTLGDPKRASNFVANISSTVAINPVLQDCDPFTVVTGALVGESLGLSLSPQLGHCFLVPFDDKNRGKLATFQIGYKGYIQLAMRSGQYRKLNVSTIKEGELVKYDPLNEEIEVILIEDDEVRESKETIGYFAMFEYLNGFRKTMYWSRKKMHAHATKYSQAYRSDIKKGNDWSFWSKDFDGMAYKTMLRQLISKWGIMSIEMQKAFESDMGVIHEDNKVEYVDNDETFEEQKTNVEKDKVEIIEKPKTQNIKSKSKPSFEEEAEIVEEFQQDNLFEPNKYSGEF